MQIHPAPARVVLALSLLLVLASVTCSESGLDRHLARYIFALEGGAVEFSWEHGFWPETVFHSGGRALVKCLFIANLVLLLLSYRLRVLQPWRRALFYIALATALSTAVVALIKQVSTLPCPGDLAEFGGTRHWVGLARVFSPDLPAGHCYPAGHASGGYAWICLAFLFPFATRRFYLALAPGLLLGIAFGIAQQLRGNHFLSHDILTLALCWTTSGLLAARFGNAVRSTGAAPLLAAPLEEGSR